MGKKGFSLTELMFAIGILSVVLFSTALIVSNINKSQVLISEKLLATEFVSALSKHLNTQVGCAASLVNLNVPTTTPTAVTINNYLGYGASAPMTLSAGVELSNKIRINSLTMKDKGIAPYDTTINGVGYRRSMAQLKIDLSVTVDDSSVPVERFIEIPVLTRTSPSSGTIDVCGLEASTAEICTAMGGVFSPPGVCTPSSACRFMGVVYGCWPYSDCSGAAYPSALRFTLASEAQIVSPPASICAKGGVPTSTGQTTYTFINAPYNKYGVGTTYSNQAYFYICLLCS